MLLLLGNSNEANPLTIFGNSLRFWGNSQNVTLNASTVSQVTNLALGNASAVQATALQQPAFVTNAINGYPVIRHDTLAKNLVATQSGITGNIYSAMVISMATYAGSYGRVLSYRNGASNDFDNPSSIVAILRDQTTSNLLSYYNNVALPTAYGTIVQGSTYYTLECLLDDTNNTITHWVNGVSVYTAALSGTISSNSINIGDGVAATSTDFRWPEFIVNLGTPTTGQQEAVRSYLRNKYKHY